MDGNLTLESIVGFLLETPLFRALSPEELSEVVRIMQIQSFRDRQEVFREGDEGDAWYVLFNGTCEVNKEAPFGPSHTIAVLEPHACFGEMAVIDGSERSATVLAMGECTVFRFPRAPFQALIGGGSLAAYKLIFGMAKVMCGRQRQVNQKFSEMVEDRETERWQVRHRLGTLLDKYTVSE